MRHFAEEQIRVRMERVEAEIARTMESPGEEAVHDLRVSIRRLRAALRLLAPFFRAGRVRRLHKLLRERMRMAGEVRNRDIAAMLARQSGVAEGSAIAGRLDEEREHMSRLLHDLLAATPELKPPKPSSRKRAARSLWREGEDETANARRVMPRLAAALFRSGNRVVPSGDAAHQPATAEQLHTVRLAVKRFRYSLEVFAPVYGATLNRRLAQLKSFQTVLGDLNDLATALEFETVTSSAEFTAWIEQRRAELLPAFETAWRQAATPARTSAWNSYLSGQATRRAPRQQAAGPPKLLA